MCKLIKIEDISKDLIKEDSYVIFGGTFDPLHDGHIDVILSLSKIFNKVLLAPTAKNPYKKNNPTSIEIRIEIIKKLLELKNIRFSLDINDKSFKVFILDFPYIYAKDLVLYCKKILKGELFWAIGEDLKDEIHSWKDWNSLNIKTILLPININLHSSDIRRKKVKVKKEVSDIIKRHSLYSKKE